MGRRGNQTFLKNQKAQKRVARANAKRAEKQARRDEKVARANAGDVTSGPPIEWNEGGERVEGEAPQAPEGAPGEERGAERKPDGGADDGAPPDPVAAAGSARSTER